MIPCLVFSRDRAMQLDLLLESIGRYATGLFDVTVLYRPTTPAFDLAYLDCLKDHSWAAPCRERDFRADVLDWLDAADGDYVCFLVDDDVFYRPLPPLWLSYGAVTSLRLGLNTTYCYTMDDENLMPYPSASGYRFTPWIAWDWREATNDYAYPLSLDGHLIPKNWLLPLVGFAFDNPTQLEAGLHAQRDELPARSAIRSAAESCLVGIPANRVSDSGGNRHWGRRDYDPEILNTAYLDGDRIDLEQLSFNRVRSPHQEIPLRFRRARRTVSA